MLEFLIICAVSFILFWVLLNFLEKRAVRSSGHTKKSSPPSAYDNNRINALLKGNKTALDNFINALATFLLTKREEDYPEILQNLATSILFSRAKPHHNAIILQVLVQSEQFQSEIALQKEMAGFLPANDSFLTNSTDLLLNVHEKANRLIKTRDALAQAVREHHYTRIWDLSGQFLSEAYLCETRGSSQALFLEFASFIGAFLIGAHFERTNLSEGNFQNAVLIYAQMTEADLAGTMFTDANLTNAKMTRAEMTAADLTGAKVAWSTLYLAKNVHESWRQARFEGETRRDNKLWRRMRAKFGATEDGH